MGIHTSHMYTRIALATALLGAADVQGKISHDNVAYTMLTWDSDFKLTAPTRVDRMGPSRASIP